MPQLPPIIHKGELVHLWQITESLDELANIFSDKIPEYIFEYNNKNHRKQLISKHIVLQKLQIDKLIFKNKNGKPLLPNTQYISISHATEFVGIGLSEKPIGIDIETFTPKLQKISKKFIHQNELVFLQENKDFRLLQIWTAKESIYKMFDLPGLSFKNDIKITQLNNQSAKAMLKNEKEISLFFNKLNDDTIICIASI